MKAKHFYTSLTRISDLQETAFSVERLPRREWETGDYVVGEVVSPPNSLSRIELTSGRMVEVVERDLIVGAFGVRYATLETVGGWQAIGHDQKMEALTAAGLFGKSTSRSTLLPSLLSLAYKGHVVLGDEKVAMRDYVQDAPERELERPVVLMVGTSMSAGKTTAARVIVHLLREAGLSVIGAQLAGRGATATSSPCRTPGLSISSTSWTRACPPPWPRRRSIAALYATSSPAWPTWRQTCS